MALVNKLQGGNIIPPVTSDLKGFNYANLEPLYVQRAWEVRDAARQKLSERDTPLSLGFKTVTPDEALSYFEDKVVDIDFRIDRLKQALEGAKEFHDEEYNEEVKAQIEEEEKLKSLLQQIVKNNQIPYNVCAYNIMECFNKPHITYNPWFAENYAKEGFIIVPEEEATVGDIAQTGPHHMIMATGQDENGNLTYDWARATPFDGIIHDGHFEKGKKIFYRFVGTDEDKKRWRDEYLAKQQLINNQKMEEGGQIKKITLHKVGGSILDQLKEQLPEMEIFDLLSHFGIDDILSGGLKNTGSVSIQITIDGDDSDNDKKVPDLKEISLGDNTYRVEVVDTPDAMETGLSGRKSLGEDEGMLFDFKSLQPQVSFWMKDTYIPLDIIFINDDDEVIKVYKGDPEDETMVTVKDVRYVVELNQNSGIKKGDELDFDPKDEGPVMKVLAPDGSTQMELKGGERIFSRKNTKTLIRMAKRADKSKSDSDYRKLGKRMFKYIHTQDTNTPEYVEVPEN